MTAASESVSQTGAGFGRITGALGQATSLLLGAAFAFALAIALLFASWIALFGAGADSTAMDAWAAYLDGVLQLDVPLALVAAVTYIAWLFLAVREANRTGDGMRILFPRLVILWVFVLPALDYGARDTLGQLRARTRGESWAPTSQRSRAWLALVILFSVTVAAVQFEIHPVAMAACAVGLSGATAVWAANAAHNIWTLVRARSSVQTN